ncbi:MAG: FixH family protein [Candidatus Marinimicrobia bacterium]|nr:FixH family protein [Candidatus Neomarinimicrobiota bacterium]
MNSIIFLWEWTLFSNTTFNHKIRSKITMTRLTFAAISILITFALLVTGCGDKNSTENDHHTIEVTMTYIPNPATVNTAISFLFKVEDDDEHMSGLTPHVEIIKEGATGHVEMETSEDTDEAGHYRGTHTFTETGTYDIHFEFMLDDGDEMDEEFSLTVQ